DMTRLLNRWLADHWPEGLAQDFPFTSISVNSNYNARRHRDGGNEGPSLIKAFGQFTGGRLAYWPDDDRSVKIEDLKPAQSVLYNVRAKTVTFNGKRAHEVTPFKGERFSLVFFTCARYWKALSNQNKLAESLGFHVPTDASLKAARAVVSM
ncbi:unnamed protein product, partial [Polarella glacialis]